jgi:hypothetical protein
VRINQTTFVSGRAGRAESEAWPSGPTVFTLHAAAASARDGDQLEGFTFRAEPIDDGRGLGRAVFLPDVATSAGLTLNAGTQGAPATLDDTATSGAILGVEPGAIVNDGAATRVTLRTGRLQARHLPVAPPAAPGAAMLVNAAVFVAPATATFTPGAQFSVPDTIGATLPGATLDVLWLDATTGTWTRVGSAIVILGRVTVQPPGITRGGLYLFAVNTTRTSTVTGRVLDGSGVPLPRALVHMGGVAALTDSNGAFALPALPAVDLGERARNEMIEVVAGRGFLPQRTASVVTLADGPMLLPDLVLDTLPSGHLRVLLVERGQVLPDRRVRTNEIRLRGRTETFIGSDGTGILEDIAAGNYGIVFGRADGRDASFRTDGFVRLRVNERVLDARLFSLRGGYDERRRGSTVVVYDAEGGGPLFDIGLVRGEEPEQGFVGRTLENGAYYLGLGRDDQITAVADTTRDGRRVLSAFTTVQTIAQRVELPVRVAPRARLGAFDRHGLVEATITGGTAGRARSVRATWPLTYREWFERTMLDDESSGGRVPLKRAPGTADATATFTVGVPRPRGHVALAETRSEFGRTLLTGAFVAFDQTPAEGDTANLSGALVPADTEFSTAASDNRLNLTADFGAQSPAGTIADVARQSVEVTTTLMGGPLRFRLPARAGIFANTRYHVCVRSDDTRAGITVAQRSTIQLTTTTGNPAAPVLALPGLSQPSPGATVSAAGFTAEFTAPSDAHFVVVRLSSDTGSEQREWTALLPATATSFTFRRLPSEVAQVLAGGRTWQLSVTVFRAVHEPLGSQPEPYKTVVANYVSLGPAELGVDALSRVSLSLTTP